MVAMAGELGRRVPGLRILLVGGEHPNFPGYARAVRDRISRLGMKDTVTLLGYRPDAVEIVGGSDVLAMPTVQHKRSGLREGLPLVGLEAMAVGTPVVAYADGGVPEMLGPCGSLISPGDRPGLLHALVRVLEDPVLSGTLARCGRERIWAKFTVSQMAARMRDRYREAAGLDHRGP
jgi:glycosyltransferase involved in cell wall biosynthesis